MAIQSLVQTVNHAAEKHSLSHRGAHNMVHRDIWGTRAKQFSNPWTPQNLKGTVNLRLAENNMLHNDVEDFIHNQLRVEGVHHLTYSTGPRGSMRLRRAAARFLENDFGSIVQITDDDIFVMPGLTSAVDAIVWATCNEGDGVIIPKPLYNGFRVDVQHRTGAVVVEAEYYDLDGYSCIDDVFDPSMNRKALETTLEQAQSNGIQVRAVMIANPHNPLGRCYPVETLKEIALFCGQNGLHFITDEIYARSVFTNPNLPHTPTFTSTLAIDLSDCIRPEMHHVLYGASKDFCANGLRLGVLYSKNKGILGAISSISPFSWSPHILQDVWAAMLENDTWRHDFFTRNAKLMQSQYLLATSFFKDHGINYYEMNAGVYIWVDLRPFFVPGSDCSSLRVTAGHCEIHEAREAEIIDICASNGVMIAPGSSYRAEDYGWFRVTFTTPTAPLQAGLDRLWVSLTHLSRPS